MIDKSLRQYQQLVKKGNGNKRPGYRGDDWGGPSYGGSSSRSSSGGNGSHDRGGRQHQAAAAPAPAKAPEPDRRSIALANQYVEPVIAPKDEPKIDVGFQEALKKQKIAQPKIDTGPKIDVGFQEILRKKQIEKDLRQKQQDPNFGQFFRPQPVVEKPKNGIMSKALGFGGDLLLTALSGGSNKALAYTAKAIQTKRRYDKIKQSALGKKYLSNLNFSNLNKDISKQIQKDDIPKVADRHPGTDKKKKTTREPKDGDGVNRILPKSLQSTVSEGMQQFLSDKQKEQYLVAQNKMKAALAEGYYVDQNGKRIALDDEQVNTLTQLITRIDSLLVDPVMMADGGRVDKALGGRVRDI